LQVSVKAVEVEVEAVEMEEEPPGEEGGVRGMG